MNYKDILKHITGISCPVFGIQWNPPTLSSDIARDIILFLENKRVLFSPTDKENLPLCISSANEIRTELISDSKKSSDEKLSKIIRQMLRHIRLFITNVEQINTGVNSIVQQSILERELIELRRKMGVLIALLSVSYGVDVHDELAIILPLNIIE